jgi:hypothetical protein
MLPNIPLAIWFGIATIASLFTTFSLGIALYVYKKPVFNYHRFFAFLTIILAGVHVTLSILLWFFGVSI